MSALYATVKDLDLFLKVVGQLVRPSLSAFLQQLLAVLTSGPATLQSIPA